MATKKIKRREMCKWTKMEIVNRVEGVVDIPPGSSVIRLLKYKGRCMHHVVKSLLNRLSRLENQPKNVPKHRNQNA